MSDRPFTSSDFGTLAPIMYAATRKCHVRRYMSKTTQDIVHGTARHFVHSPTDYGPRDPRADVRDAYLRVTLDTGFDATWLVSDLMADVADGAFDAEGYAGA